MNTTVAHDPSPKNRLRGGRVATLCAAGFGLALGMYALAIRPRLLHWGATPDEISRTYPTDELIPHPDSSVFTMATTLPAPPEQVWPWLAQMGGDRAGWYSWDRLDHWGVPSLDHLVAEWQSPQPGQHLLNARDGSNWMTVILVEPNRTLALRSNMEFPSGRSFDPAGPLPRVYLDGIWSFHLRPIADGQTRVVARMRGRSCPMALLRPLGMLLGDPLHFNMQVRQFHNLRTRVSSQAPLAAERVVTTQRD